MVAHTKRAHSHTAVMTRTRKAGNNLHGNSHETGTLSRAAAAIERERFIAGAYLNRNNNAPFFSIR